MNGATDRDIESAAEEMRGLRPTSPPTGRRGNGAPSPATGSWAGCSSPLSRPGGAGYVKHKKDAERREHDREVGCLAARFADEPAPDGC